MDGNRAVEAAMTKLLYKPAGIALFKAVIDRGAAEGIRRLTGVWPGDNGEPSGEGA
jgi:hypothetical protein